MSAPDTVDLVAYRVHAAADALAREITLGRLERAYNTLARGGRLDVVADDLRWVLGRITTDVDRQIATGLRVVDQPTLGALLRDRAEAA